MQSLERANGCPNSTMMSAQAADSPNYAFLPITQFKRQAWYGPATLPSTLSNPQTALQNISAVLPLPKTPLANMHIAAGVKADTPHPPSFGSFAHSCIKLCLSNILRWRLTTQVTTQEVLQQQVCGVGTDLHAGVRPQWWLLASTRVAKAKGAVMGKHTQLRHKALTCRGVPTTAVTGKHGGRKSNNSGHEQTCVGTSTHV
eukprot:1159309-Pelagomonas_calceolata.AAC.3